MRPENYVIEVNNKIDAEYIQKKAFEVDIDWWVSESKIPVNLNCRYVLVEGKKLDSIAVNQPSDEDRFSKSRFSKWPLYKFPSQAEEIVKLFEKEKEPEFKVGDWIIGKDSYFPRTAKKIDTISEGLLRYKQDDAVHPMHVRRAVDAEIEQALILEAKEKGFVLGAKVSLVKAEGMTYYKSRNEVGYCHVIGERQIRAFEVVNNNLYALVTETTNDVLVCLEGLSVRPSHPKIEINGYKAEFKDWGLDFNGGCAKIDKNIFKDLYILMKRDLGNSNKEITSVKIGAGEFAASQIKEIADYYNAK